MREVVGDALHNSPLSEDEYLAFRGRERAEKVETDKESLTDYIRVSLSILTVFILTYTCIHNVSFSLMDKFVIFLLF